MKEDQRFKITVTNEPILNRKDFQKFVSKDMPKRKNVDSILFVPKSIDRNNEFFFDRLTRIPVIRNGNIEYANCTGKPGYGLAVAIRDAIVAGEHLDSEGRLLHCIKVELINRKFAASLPATISTGTQTAARDSKKEEFFKTSHPFGKGLMVFLAEKEQAIDLRNKSKN